jgi:excinuclease ABC subunit C
LPGVGARKRALLRAFGSVKRIEEATLEDLLKVPSISEKVAQEILESLRSAPD